MKNQDEPQYEAPDFSGVVPILPLNWEADDDAFRYLLGNQIDSIVAALDGDGVPLDSANIAALHEAAWAYRAKVLA